MEREAVLILQLNSYSESLLKNRRGRYISNLSTLLQITSSGGQALYVGHGILLVLSLPLQ